MTFKINQQQRTAGTLPAPMLAAILDQIETIGYAIVEGLVSDDTCELLGATVLEDVEHIRVTGKPTKHEQYTGRGHLQLGLRRHAPYVKADLVANPLIECIVAAVLGPRAWLGFYNGNVNCPDSTHQPLHFDRPFSWKTPEAAAKDGQSWPPPTTSLSCSVALKEITQANGATEIYPGTHHETEVTKWSPGDRIENHPDLMDKWGPPERMTIPAGGVCFRDPRMWHRGVPNCDDTARAMIAITYHAARGIHWRGRLMDEVSPENAARLKDDSALRLLDNGELADGRLVFQGDTKEVFESPNLHKINRNVRFAEAPLRVNHFLDSQGRGGARVVRSSVLSTDES